MLNLLTEDNLPYYHNALESASAENSVWREWNGLWTAEEGQHAIAIRSYLLTSRNCDPYELEDDRMATMQSATSRIGSIRPSFWPTPRPRSLRPGCPTATPARSPKTKWHSS